MRFLIFHMETLRASGGMCGPLQRRLDMFDIFFLALGAGFFVLTYALARLLARV
jgi:hypothetical protein